MIICRKVRKYKQQNHHQYLGWYIIVITNTTVFTIIKIVSFRSLSSIPNTFRGT